MPLEMKAPPVKLFAAFSVVTEFGVAHELDRSRARNGVVDDIAVIDQIVVVEHQS